MNDQKWNKGAPPHIGWWVASSMRQLNIWRWWNGFYWSRPCATCMNMHAIVKNASKDCNVSDRHIEWTNYWPKNARVPRINPNGVRSVAKKHL